jgi:uncharacterized membrane protein
MDMKKKKHLSFLLVSLLALILAYPFLIANDTRYIFLAIISTAVLSLAIYSTSYDRKHLILGMTFGVPAVLLNIATVFFKTPVVYLITIIVSIIFYGFTVFTLLSHILKSKKVDSEIIYGAICAYLLIGFMWGGIYLLIEVLNPGSFYIDAAHNIDNKTTYADFLYFSFVTVATLGYGDISPVTPLARNVSIMEGIIGVFYLAILVARLVGLYTVESNRK